MPAVAIVIGVLLAYALGTVAQSPEPGGWTITVDRARDTLMGLLSLLVAGFSIVLAVASLTIQNVVGRFSLRMLRLYNRELRDKVLISMFALTANFIIVELFRTRDLATDSPAPVPGVAVSLGLIFLFGITIIWYITSLSAWFRVDGTARRVARGAIRGADAIAERYADLDVADPDLFDQTAGAVPVTAPRSGYYSDLDIDLLYDFALSHDLTVVIDRLTGDSMLSGEPIGWVEAADGSSAMSFDSGPVAKAIRIDGALSLEGAVDYRIVVLVDIAIMALSPAINDPNTAVQVIQEMTFMMPELARFDPGSRMKTDDDGNPRVVVKALTFGDYVDLATEQIVLYGASDPAVVIALDRLIDVLDRLELNDGDAEAVERLRRRVHPVDDAGVTNESG